MNIKTRSNIHLAKFLANINPHKCWFSCLSDKKCNLLTKQKAVKINFYFGEILTGFYDFIFEKKSEK